jgi:IS5 family transposase
LRIEYQQSEAFVQGRRRHAAVESAINALEVHGLDVCPDHGLDGFKRYVALAIVARNLQKLGAILQGRGRHALRHADARKRAA